MMTGPVPNVVDELARGEGPAALGLALTMFVGRQVLRHDRLLAFVQMTGLEAVATTLAAMIKCGRNYNDDLDHHARALPEDKAGNFSLVGSILGVQLRVPAFEL